MSLITAKCIISVFLCIFCLFCAWITEGKPGPGWILFFGLYLIFWWEEKQ